MQLNGRKLLCSLIGAGLFAFGCGDNSGSDGGTGCSVDSNCRSNEICHPVAKFCVKTCNSASDCTGSGNTVCATYTWVPSLPDGGVGAYPPDAGPITTGSTKICQCPSTASCQGSGQPGSTGICGDEDKVCEVPCTSSNNCRANRTCQTSTGQCRTPPATPTTCNASNPQPDVCQNGQVCTSNTCLQVPSPNCGNFTAGHPGYSWTPTNNAPVIYSIGALPGFPQMDSFCQDASAPWHYQYRIRAYWVGGTFPTTAPTISGILHYVRDNGSEGPSPSILPSSIVLANGNHNVQFDAGFCSASGGGLTIGLHFFTGGMSGNGACGVEP